MAENDPQSLTQEIFRGYRSEFEYQFRRFLTNPATPAPARREEAIATVAQLATICAEIMAAWEDNNDQEPATILRGGLPE